MKPRQIKLLEETEENSVFLIRGHLFALKQKYYFYPSTKLPIMGERWLKLTVG